MNLGLAWFVSSKYIYTCAGRGREKGGRKEEMGGGGGEGVIIEGRVSENVCCYVMFHEPSF